MIALGGRTFAGPFMVPLWTPPRRAALFAVMVPGWRLLTFRALHFGDAERLSRDALRAERGYASWLAQAGTDWNLYVAVLELPFASPAQRRAELAQVSAQYRPEFLAPAGHRAPTGARAPRTRTNIQD